MAKQKSWKQVSILAVAQALGMEFKRLGNNNYRWVEHDSFMINSTKNVFSWFSRDLTGDVINLVQLIREEQTGQKISFKEAKHYIENGSFPEFKETTEKREPFKYYLKRFENKNMTEGIAYLTEERKLSHDTIDFFRKQGVLAQATLKTGDYYEPILVFKSLNASKEVVGASLQGIRENYSIHDRGRLKRIMGRSDGMTGLHVDIGVPTRLIVAEAPIDLMSYYELHKESLKDVRLLAMDGLKEGVISRHFMELQALKKGEKYQVDYSKSSKALEHVASVTDFFSQKENQEMITLAIDNDEAGHKFIKKLTDKKISVKIDIPEISPGQNKMDWNDYLKKQKQPTLDETYQNQIDTLISEITFGDEGYYLWHDYELEQLNASESILEDFHQSLEDIRYSDDGINLYVEASANDGATGYLSLEGNVLDREGLKDYLLDNGFYGLSGVAFLEKLQIAIENTWDKIQNHYNKKLDEIIVKYHLGSKVAVNEKEKSLDYSQETAINEQTKKNETNIGGFSEQAQGAAPLPEATKSQPLKDLSPSQSKSHSLLHFTIENPKMSIYKDNYHPIKPHELTKLNHYAANIQNAAKWYVDHLADTTLHYFYQQGEKQYSINIDFKQYHFMHLTGLFPLKKDQSAIQTLYDFAEGRGAYENIMIANRDAAFQKIKALPDLKAILETNSFYFDQVEDIPNLNSLSLEQAIKSNDKDILLALSSNNENLYPASLMELTNELMIQTENSQHKNIILGVYQEREGEITQLSINKDYITDNGKKMRAILKRKQAPSLENYSSKDSTNQRKEENKFMEQQNLNPEVPDININEKQETSKPQLNVVFDFSENETIGEKYAKGDIIPYNEFIEVLYKANPSSFGTYDKTYFELSDEKGNLLVEQMRYDVGSETETLSQQLLQNLKGEYLDIAKEADEAFIRQGAEVINIPKLYVKFISSENYGISQKFNDTYLYPYKGFTDELYQIKSSKLISKEKTYFELYDENENILAKNMVYDFSSEYLPLSQQLDQNILEEKYLKIAQFNDSLSQLSINYENKDLEIYELKKDIERIKQEMKDSHYEISSKISATKYYQELNTEGIAILENKIENLSTSTTGLLSVFKRKESQELEQAKQKIADYKASSNQLEEELNAFISEKEEEIENLKFSLSAMEKDLPKLEEEKTDLYIEKFKLKISDFKSSLQAKQFKNFNYDDLVTTDKQVQELIQLKDELEKLEKSLPIIPLKYFEDYVKDPTKENIVAGEKVFKESMVIKDTNTPKLDSDADGLSDEKEYGQGTNPFGDKVAKEQEMTEKSVNQLIIEKDTKALSNKLKEGIKDYLKSDQYKLFLTAMSKFHNYSPRNIQLLIAQNPMVSQVASFKKWKNDFDRSVNKGEKSLRVWAPIEVIEKDQNGEPKKDPEGNIIKKTYFKLVPVFDVSQTSGKELPTPIYELEGSHEDYANLYRAAKEVAANKGIDITIDNSTGEAKGYYSPSQNKIVLKGGMSEQQTLKTLFHELAHSDLHNEEAMKKKQVSYSTAELQAESVAFVVANHYGFDTGEYSFGYLAGWSQDKNGLSDLEAQLVVVQKEANNLIKKLDTNLEKYQTKQLGQNKFTDKMNQYRKQVQADVTKEEVTTTKKQEAPERHQSQVV